ncbi:hypothetical protein B0H13DRAFT_2301458 [Mycena leptocephala]|nr:hypothetical protein B0H13DRAFT_2301458 [Mycena leptocephala]
MRTRNVSGLPPASDTGRCEVLLEFMGHVLTQTRHDIKAALRTDIATLTRTCIRKAAYAFGGPIRMRTETPRKCP